MKRTNVYLDEEQARTLRHLAVEEGRSFTDLVREALDEYVSRRGLNSIVHAIPPRETISPAEWRARFLAALDQVHAGAPAPDESEQIEREITAAHTEARCEQQKNAGSSRS